MQNYDLLENFIVFMLEIKLWTGRKTLKPEDLAAGGIDLSKLPPDTLANLGSKRIIGKEALSPFAAIKREAEKQCLAKGIRFLGCYAVPAEAAEELSQQLNRLRDQFHQERERLLRQYDAQVEGWIAENPPQWASVIRAAIEPAGSVYRALHFSYTPIAITAPDGLTGNGLGERAEGLLEQLCQEIRQAARAAYQASYRNRHRVTRKALRPIYNIRQKLAGLAFLDPLIPKALTAIDDSLALVPAKGPLEGNALHALAGLLGGQLAYLGRPQAGSDQDEADPPDERPTADLRPTACGAIPLRWDF